MKAASRRVHRIFTNIPRDCNLTEGVAANGPLIDNGYSGWGGTARIDWPEWATANSTTGRARI